MEKFNGKAIYNPSGKAGEYSEWACNFYVGCSHGCTYCYLKKGRGAKVLGGNYPVLKKGFKDEHHALRIFEKELKQNVEALQQHGLFFSFTTDPLLDETKVLTLGALDICIAYGVPVKILTKNSDNALLEFIPAGENDDRRRFYMRHGESIAIGFTLTGHSEMEPNAPINAQRVAAMRVLHTAGYKTFASIEPVIDFPTAKVLIKQTLGHCDLYKIGLMAGQKYDAVEAQTFVEWLQEQSDAPTIYLKDRLRSLTNYVLPHETPGTVLPENFVVRGYNIFH